MVFLKTNFMSTQKDEELTTTITILRLIIQVISPVIPDNHVTSTMFTNITSTSTFTTTTTTTTTTANLDEIEVLTSKYDYPSTHKTPSFTVTTKTTTTPSYTFTTAEPDQFDTEFANFMLSSHNAVRLLHHSQKLSWNSDLYKYAQDYVREYNCSGILSHSGGKYGENLAIGYSPSGAFKAWYDEGNNYQYGTEETYNHFTAIVWNNTQHIGCAYKYCNPTWGIYIVCSYNPPGNVIGYSKLNVFPP